MISWPSSSWRKAAGSHVASGYSIWQGTASPIRFLLWSKTSSTINLSFPSRSMIGAGGGTLRPSMSEGKYFFSAVTLNTGWQWRARGRSRRKAFAGILSTTLKGPNDFGRKARPTNIRRANWKGPEEPSSATNVIDTVGKTTVFEHFKKRNMEKDKKKDERREKRERMTQS